MIPDGDWFCTSCAGCATEQSEASGHDGLVRGLDAFLPCTELKRHDLALLLGISKRTLSRWRTGNNIGIKQLQAIDEQVTAWLSNQQVQNLSVSLPPYLPSTSAHLLPVAKRKDALSSTLTPRNFVQTTDGENVLSKYEEQRLASIQENNEVLCKLGLSPTRKSATIAVAADSTPRKKVRRTWKAETVRQLRAVASQYSWNSHGSICRRAVYRDRTVASTNRRAVLWG
mmetsp:Transcript_40985/g.68082  ORF Transcript_40985/g.68082 Transcript_40985/m.68082 type:complete len:228 (-) Transcript_40985:334-1017(-)